VKLDEHLVLELTISFELLVPKGEFSGTLQAAPGSSEHLNIKFFLNPQSR
jgi:hypothetical protein